MKKLAALLAVLLLLTLCAGALADVKPGDRGDEVKAMQELLHDLGWLSETPDGVYGRKTQSALLSFQMHAGLPANGVADEATMASLQKEWNARFGNEPPAFCTTEPADGALKTTYCAEHLAILEQDEALQATGKVEDARRACALWQIAIDEMYDEWINTAPASEKLAVLAAYGAWNSMLEQQRVSLTAAYPTDPLLVEKQIDIVLKAQAVSLCALRAARGEGE